MKKMFLKSAVVGSFLLFLFYYLLLFLITKDPRHPLEQFALFQPWMSILIIGFGIQVGLYSLIKRGGMVAGTGGAVSGASMVACCAHHAVEVLPILGISGAAIFLTEYQKEFLIFGVVANLAGIIYMLWLIFNKKHK